MDAAVVLDDGAVVNYTTGSGTSTLTFTYTVAAGQNTPDLDYTSTAALALNGGTVEDAAGNQANLALPTPDTTADTLNTAKIAIDTTPTTITTNVLWQNSNGNVGMWLVQNGQNAGWTELGQITPSSSGPWTALGCGRLQRRRQ